MSPQDSPHQPQFLPEFQGDFDTLLKWRRDVRRFQTTPLPDGMLDELLSLAALAPSVGNSQPWRFVKVHSPNKRKAVREHFKICNTEALNDYHGERAKQYAQLKLSGMDKSPTQLAVFCDHATLQGHGLGKKTMPETLQYSVVMAVHTLWLAARARGVGVGWVSILDPKKITKIMDVPADWAFVAYLCIGWPEEEHEDPELVRHGWQDRVDISKFIIER